jgi:hypothetical protein
LNEFYSANTASITPWLKRDGGEVPKTGSPLLSETTIPVYPFVSSFLHDSSKSFSIRDQVALLSDSKKPDVMRFALKWGKQLAAEYAGALQRESGKAGIITALREATRRLLGGGVLGTVIS